LPLANIFRAFGALFRLFGFPQKSKLSANGCGRSANGAKYVSQGQARSEAERVAPGERKRSDPALKARNTRDISAFQALFDRAYRNQGRRASLCSALAPGFHMPRLWRSVSTFWAKQCSRLPDLHD
jgi:hypothetical protein